MQTLVGETEETQRLEQILRVIERRRESLRSERVKENADLLNFRKYMWEDVRLFDAVEQAYNEQLASTQERTVHDAVVSLHKLSKLASSPYYGRIDFRENGSEEVLQVYIGLYSLFDEDQNLLIHDWRAPISSMFYDYEVGLAEYVAPGGVIAGDLLLKRQYKIQDGKMAYMLDCSLAINDEILQEALARNTSEKMRQIVTSIQKEQNAIIRDDRRRILIVQGPAGSGKTSIAMHRAAYLMYRHRGHITAGNLLIFSPNEVFADYISTVLPELGEENIREATFDDYAKSIVGRKVSFESKNAQMEFILSSRRDYKYALRTRSIEFKSSQAFLRILRSYVRHLTHSKLRFSAIELHGRVVMSGSVVEELYRTQCSHMPILQGLERLKDRVLARITYSSERDEKTVEQQIDKVLLERDAVRLYRDLFKDHNVFRKVAGDELLPENLKAICELTYKSMQGSRVLYEDIAPVLLVKRLVDGIPRYGNIRHLIIDEAQDYTPVHFEIIRHLFSDCSMTILGDMDQAINPYTNLGAYDVLREIFGRDAGEVVRLTKSYRSTEQITSFARSALETEESADAVRVRRSGPKPQVVRVGVKEELTGLVSARLDELRAAGMNSVAVICKSAEESLRVYSHLQPKHDIHLVESESITFHHGLVAMPVYMAKGLEFDAVIIYDAGDHIYSDESERKLFYMACTRALHSLTVYFTGEPSPLIPMQNRERFDYRDEG